MKNSLKLLALMVLLITSCSKDGGALDIADVQLTIAENTRAGAIITVFPKRTEGLEFTILSQSPSFSFNLNPSSGELSINDPEVFDYERFPELTAQIQVSDGSDQSTFDVTVRLEDIDEVLGFLESQSEEDYLAANDGDWVSVNSYEYDLMLAEFRGATTVGAAPSTITNPNSNPFFVADVTMVLHDESDAIPPGAYIIGFKINVPSGYAFLEGSQIKLAEGDPLVPLKNLGSTLPEYTAGGPRCFVLKGNRTPTTATGPSYLGFYNTFPTLYRNTGVFTSYVGEGNLSQIVLLENAEDTRFEPFIQAFYTLEKQTD